LYKQQHCQTNLYISSLFLALSPNKPNGNNNLTYQNEATMSGTSCCSVVDPAITNPFISGKKWRFLSTRLKTRNELTLNG
jgi:hypothetical protein